MAVCQVKYLYLIHRYREQAPSHIWLHFKSRNHNQPNNHFHNSTNTTTASTGRAMR